jgi:hypothetical protein
MGLRPYPPWKGGRRQRPGQARSAPAAGLGLFHATRVPRHAGQEIDGLQCSNRPAVNAAGATVSYGVIDLSSALQGR